MFGHAKHLSRQWTRWKSFTWFLSQHLTRILLKTVICCSHPISHKAWHCYLSQTISNINTWRPWLLFTGPVNIHDVFIPRITARDCCNVILFEASTSLCFWTHQSCSKYKLLSSHSFVNVKVKVKFILEQDTKALEGKYFSFNLGATWGGVVNATPWRFYPRERQGTHWIEGWVGPRAGLNRCEKSRPNWDSIPEPSSQ